MAASAEAYIVVTGTQNGKRTARRYPLNVPLPWARGQYERLSDRAINDMVKDLQHEQHRRAGTLAALGGWDPDKTQIRRNK
jgi:hypothetical protein